MAYGLRLTAYGLRLTAYGLRLTAYGESLTHALLRGGLCASRTYRTTTLESAASMRSDCEPSLPCRSNVWTAARAMLTPRGADSRYPSSRRSESSAMRTARPG